MQHLPIAAALAVALAAPALAQQGAPPPPSAPPPAAAAPLTRAEVQAMVREHFARVDSDHDGAVSRAEAEAAGGPRGPGRMRRGISAPPPGAPDGPPPAADGAPPPPPPGGMAGMAGMSGRGMGMGRGIGMFTMLNGRNFDRADADHDGKVSQAEAEGEALRLFDRVDADRDGTISPEERRAARDLMRERMMERMRERRD